MSEYKTDVFGQSNKISIRRTALEEESGKKQQANCSVNLINGQTSNHIILGQIPG